MTEHEPVTCPWCGRSFVPAFDKATACECGHAMYRAPTADEWTTQQRELAEWRRDNPDRFGTYIALGSWSMWNEPVAILQGDP
jgi:hypothetical protein